MRTFYLFFAAPPELKKFRNEVDDCLECGGVCQNAAYGVIGHHITVAHQFSVDGERAAQAVHAFDRLTRSCGIRAVHAEIGTMFSFAQESIHLPVESPVLDEVTRKVQHELSNLGMPPNKRDRIEPHFTLARNLNRDTFGAAWHFISGLRQPVGQITLDRLCLYEKTPESRWVERRTYRLA